MVVIAAVDTVVVVIVVKVDAAAEISKSLVGKEIQTEQNHLIICN